MSSIVVWMISLAVACWALHKYNILLSELGIIYSEESGHGRNSELIISTLNILLKVININFSTLKFTTVLKFFYIVSTFVYDALGGHHPPKCSGAHGLWNCA